MFNLGMSEIFIICVIALIFIGPKQLPEIARTIARFLNELKRAAGEMRSTFVDFDQVIPKAKAPEAKPPASERTPTEPGPTMPAQSAAQTKVPQSEKPEGNQ